MPLKKTGVLFIVTVILLAVAIAALFLPDALSELNEGETIHILVRGFALYGFLFLSVTTLTTPFLREIIQAFGKPFIKIHHSFSVLGILLITLHPVFNAIQQFSLSVFIPRFDSWQAFWTYGGRLAFILVYMAVVAALLRKAAPKYWRQLHMLTYVVLLLGIVHAFLIGEDFANIGIMILFATLFIASIGTFIIKRYYNYRLKKQANKQIAK